MSLQALLSEVHPDWHAAADQAAVPDELLARARSSALGQRLLVRGLPAPLGEGLLAPRPGRSAHASTLQRWPRPRVLALIRDLGVLAYAPAIRAEVRREPVRWLRRQLGNSYLLALDRTVWDGRVERAVHQRLSRDWEALVAAPGFLEDAGVLGTLLDRQGRSELYAWASRRDRPLSDWMQLLHARDVPGPAHLPEKAVLVLASHHEGRNDG